MPPPPASGPDRPAALSAHERAVLADIEHDLDASSPALARQMARPMTSTTTLPFGLVHSGLLVLALFLVLAVAGLVPGVVWAAVAVLAAMVLVPWVMLRAFEMFEREDDEPPTSA